MSTSSEHINRRNNPDGTKGHTDVNTETENKKGPLASLLGRRKFLVMGGAGAFVALGSAGAAAAVIRAGAPNASPRSQDPVGLSGLDARDPEAESLTGPNGTGAAPLGVRYLALAGTDGWATLPSASMLDATAGVADIGPYFPDPLAEPSNRTTYVFSFRNVTGMSREDVAAQKGHTQFNAPLFYSTVGEELWLTLTNLGLNLRPDLVDGHTLHWHGFRNAIPFYDGVPESSISVPIGHDFTYVYRPKDAGTYMYHCHFEDVEHVTMGMQGIVYVKPDPSDKVAYKVESDGSIVPANQVLTGFQQKAYGVYDGDAQGESWYDREFAILLGEVDVRAHFNDAHIQATDWTDFHAEFATMNGRSYPDTLKPNSIRDIHGVLHAQIDGGGLTGSGEHVLTTAVVDSMADRLASNPNSSLVEGNVGERILIRLVNLGFYNRTFVFPGLDIDVVGRDARFVRASVRRTKTDSVQLGPGESRDVMITATVAGEYPFYDRDMTTYPGNAAGSDAWVGGARSLVKIYPADSPLARQLKPNGWAGEVEWHGEQPLVATSAPKPPKVDIKVEIPAGSNRRWLKGTVTIDPTAQIQTLQWQRTQSADAPGASSNNWSNLSYTPGSPIAVNFQTPSTNRTRSYWVRAVDTNGNSVIASAGTL